jgi:hypothetical protein
MKHVFLALILVCSNAWAQNFGFETGNLTGWTASGNDAAVVGSGTYNPGGGKTWVVNPYGTHMGRLQPSSVQFNAATTSLGLNSAENTAIRNFMSANAGGGSPNPTTAAWIKRTITLQAGSTYTFGWNYLSTDYTPFNDGSLMSLTHATNANITPTLNNSQQRYALLGFTNPGTGNYSTGSYGSTGWQLATFTVPETGDYVLGFSTFNLGDTALSPMLFIDEIQGTTTLNGASYGPVAPNAGSTAPSTPSTPPPPPPPEFCCGGSSAVFTPNPVNTAKVNTFVNRTTQDSQVYIEQLGDSNTIIVQQTGTRNNYVDYNSNGNNNTINVTQSGNASTVANYVELNVFGNTNTANITQSSTGGNKNMFATVNNSNNSLTVLQKDAGNHLAEITLTGSNKTVNLTQEGSAGHRARIELSGTPISITATQSGSTQQNYSINYNCTTAGGCGAITVNQGQ